MRCIAHIYSDRLLNFIVKFFNLNFVAHHLFSSKAFSSVYLDALFNLKCRQVNRLLRHQNLLVKVLRTTSTVNRLIDMPKQNQYKNMFKSAESSSLAPEQSSQSQAQASSSSSQSKTSQHVPSSSSDGDSSQFVVPSTFAGVSSQPTKHKDDEDNRDWLVDVIDQHQVTKTVRMKIRDVHNLKNGKRIIVECNEYSVPIGKAGGIIAGVMGQLATNALYFPISFKKWSDMPKSYFDRVFDEILMARFLFRIDRKKAKSWASGNLNKKWKDHRHKLWHAVENPLLSKEEIIRRSPNGIPMDQWALFVNYRMDEKTRVLDIYNSSSFSLFIASYLSLTHCCGCFILFLPLLLLCHIFPHTGGATSLARRRAEMMAKGMDVDRGKMWTETHKRKDGSYVTEAAREIGEKIEEIRSQRPESIVEVSPYDALGLVLGPEHPGHVRGLGLGVVPTVAFKQTSRRFKHVDVSSSSTSAPTPEWQQDMTSMKSQLNALLSLYQRNIGNIPEEFAHLFPPPPQVSDIDSGTRQSPIEPKID